MNYWKTLLIEQKNRGNKGFTIPFVLGSQEYLGENDPCQNIEDLINDIVENSEFETCLRYCMDTDDLILEIRNPKNKVYYPTHKNLEQSNFSISIFNDDVGKDIETVVKLLFEKYQEYIKENKFSKHEDGWGDYSSNEKAFIESCFIKKAG